MDRRWPLGIVIAMCVVMAVNFAVLWYALQNPPELDDTYASEQR